MNIIQITDLHLCKDGGPAFLHADSSRALRQTVDYFLQTPIRADAVVVSGDISSDGSLSAYQAAKRELGRLPWPVYYIPGNHDDRRTMQQAALIPADPQQAVCHRVDLQDVSLILLDTVLDGQSRGGVSDDTLALLSDCLPQDPTTPVLLFMHHVPFVTGYTAMDEPFEQAEKLTALLSGHPCIRVCCGHIHASMATQIRQISMITCSPVSMAMEFDLTAQGGDAFYTSEPQFALHCVDGGQIITHFATIPTREARLGPYTFSV